MERVLKIYRSFDQITTFFNLNLRSYGQLFVLVFGIFWRILLIKEDQFIDSVINQISTNWFFYDPKYLNSTKSRLSNQNLGMGL